MRRMHVLGVIVVAGAVAIAAADLAAQQGRGEGRGQGRGEGRGQGRGGGGGGAVGAIQKVATDVYMVPGQGGNTGVYVSANGVVLVDTKNPNNGQGILDQVRTVTDKPITHIINTHTHGDHTGSNVFFPASVEVVTHENTGANMKRMEAFQDAANAHGLPDRTFRDRLTLLSGTDAIDLYYFGRAHTDGDMFVVFRNARVMHTGDAFPNQGPPFIDRSNGGSGVAYGDTLSKAASTIRDVDTIITGHAATTMTFQGLADYAEFNTLFLAHARASLEMGKTPEQAMMDLDLPDKFSGYNLGGGRGGAGGNFGVIFEELREQQ